MSEASDGGSEAIRALREQLYPECRAGGFSRVDGSVDFFSRIRALARPGVRVLDFGAGRGRWYEDDTVEFRRGLRDLRDVAERVIGVDVDPQVRSNPALDEAHVVEPSASIPVEDGSMDIVIADWTFEHVEDPRHVASELTRVLAAGGWLCARTPNRWGYIAAAATVLPRRWHASVLAAVQPGRERRDVFPAPYRLNSRAALRAVFPTRRFEHCVYSHNPEPAYFGTSELAWRVARAVSEHLPSGLGAVLHAFLRKIS